MNLQPKVKLFVSGTSLMLCNVSFSLSYLEAICTFGTLLEQTLQNRLNCRIILKHSSLKSEESVILLNWSLFIFLFYMKILDKTKYFFLVQKYHGPWVSFLKVILQYFRISWYIIYYFFFQWNEEWLLVINGIWQLGPKLPTISIGL